jgi:hypothetical protein
MITRIIAAAPMRSTFGSVSFNPPDDVGGAVAAPCGTPYTGWAFI